MAQKRKNAERQQHGPGPGGPGMGQAVEHATNFWKTIGRLATYLKPWLGGIALVVILAISATIVQVVAPSVLGQATTVIYAGIKQGLHSGRYQLAYGTIAQILVTIAILYVISFGLNAVQQRMMARISQKIVYQLRKDLKAKLTRLPIKFYDDQANGDLMSRAINDMDNIAGSLQQNLAQLVTSVIMFVGVLAMMVWISPLLTVIAGLMIVLTGIIIKIIAPQSQRLFKRQQASLGKLNAQVEETYHGHAVVRSFNQQPRLLKEFAAENEKYYAASWKAQFVSGIIMPLTNLAKNIGYIAVSIVGGLMVAGGRLTLGNAQAFLTYVNNISQPISNLANLANTIQSTAASAERIFEILDAPEMRDLTAAAKDPITTDAKISFANVDFSYTPDKQILENFSLKVQPGQKVAIVGPTGAGKSTLINLLERFYDVDGGAIYLDGTDTRQMTREHLRTHLGMVLQETWLFNGTIWDNLKYGKPAASDAEILAAAKAAYVDEFVQQLPDGYQTVLDEGASNLSQGQQQLVTIARALLVNPDVLILDEATSSVDTRTERKIQAAMDKLISNKTSFIVAHRLSTIQNADQILVLNHGQIVEMGTHTSLLAKKGFYADLYNAQFSQA